MKKKINIVIIQKKFTSTIENNISDLDLLITNKKIAKNSILVLHELTLTKYFCISKDNNNFKYSISNDSVIFKQLKDICIKNKVLLLISYFEKFKGKYI